jgi:Na+-translocating ferredoxin:NAD+ oxidoreductase RnfA subunit
VDFVLDLLQGVGIAAAIGVRPFLPVLLVGALAVADLGVDFEGTSFAFLEEWPFLFAVLLLVMLVELGLRRRTDIDTGPLVWALLAIAAALGALEAAGSLADHGHPIIPGIVLGVLAAALGFYAARSLFGRVRRRLDPDAQAVLPLYGEAAALLAAGAAVLFPPLAILVIAALAWLLAGARRRAGEKYAGLRILR